MASNSFERLKQHLYAKLRERLACWGPSDNREAPGTEAGRQHVRGLVVRVIEEEPDLLLRRTDKEALIEALLALALPSIAVEEPDRPRADGG